MIKVNLYFGLLLSLISYYSQSFGQGSTAELKNFTMHSPNAASLGKYGDYPVNMSTGVPDIQIPLYVVRSGALELPISLSYHASGIKVDQEASFVGLGWSLNAGGVITRIINDKQDQNYPEGFLYTGRTLPNYNSILNTNGAGGIGNNDTLVEYYRDKDKVPDLFSIASQGISGNFCLDNSGNYVSIELDSNKYTVDFSKNLIVVKDKIGNTYRFGRDLVDGEAFETSITRSESSDGGSYGYPQYTSSFYLTEIISSDYTDTISFRYKKNIYSDSKVVSSTRYTLYNGGPTSGTTDQVGANFDGIRHNRMYTDIPNLQVIDRILFKNGSVEFTTANDRVDISGVSSIPSRTRITGYTVYDAMKNVVNSVQFENASYFDRTGLSYSIDGSGISAERKKAMKLNSVKLFDSRGQFVNDYKFEYDSTPLPPRNTCAQDFWGYYNGKNNSTFIPQTFYTNSFTGQPLYFGGNRNTDIAYMKAGTLTKVTYPTGGYTVYDYESNYYVNAAQSQNQVIQRKQVPIQAINRLSTCSAHFLPDVPINNVVEFEVTEPLKNNGVDAGLLYVMFSDYVTYNGLPMTFKFTDLTTGNVIYFEHGPSGKSQQKIINQNIEIRQGHKYRMEANTNGVTGSSTSMCNSPYIDAGISYDYLMTTTQDQVTPEQAGGLRVKTVTNYNFENAIVTQKKYEYGEKEYGSEKIGVGELISSVSNNFYKYPLLYAELTSHKSLATVLWFTSNSQTQLGSNQGCPVSYSKVTVKDIMPGQSLKSGKTEFYYSSPIKYNDPRSSNYFPYDIYTYPLWESIHLIKQVSYSEPSFGVYVPVKSIEHQYTRLLERRIKTLNVFEVEPDVYDGTLNSGGGWFYMINNPKRFCYYNYFVSRGKLLKEKEIVMDFKDGVESLAAVTTFEYNSYLNLSKEQKVNSKSETVESIYKYTSDLNYSNLVANNQISLPVQNEQSVNGKVIRGSILRYNDQGKVVGEYKALNSVVQTPYVVSSTLPSYYLKERSLEYDDVYKKIQAVQEENASPTIYLWSYRGEYPIAEIKNATYSQVELALNGKAEVSRFKMLLPTDVQVNSFLSRLRSSLPNSFITTYTVKPLYGITSKTDPKGMTTFFEYDEFQRLKTIKDQNKSIVNHFNYNFKK